MTTLACQDCRWGLMHWHCLGCGKSIQEQEGRCEACRSRLDNWLGLGTLLLAIAAWTWALYRLHEFLTTP